MEILIINKNKTVFNWNSKILKNNDIEGIATKVSKNKYLKKIAIFTLAYSMYSQKIVMAAATSANSLDPLGWRLLKLIRGWAKWVLLLMCVVEIARSGTKGENKTLAIVTKYLIIYAAMYLVPVLFEAVETSFPGGN